MAKFSRENLDESLVIHKICLTFHCGTFVLYSISSYYFVVTLKYNCDT